MTLVYSLYALGRLSSTLYLIYPCAFIYKKKLLGLITLIDPTCDLSIKMHIYIYISVVNINKFPLNRSLDLKRYLEF